MENVRILPDGEAVSVDGTHLGHNLPDYKGNRHLVRKPTVFKPWDVNRYTKDSTGCRFPKHQRYKVGPGSQI